MHHNVQEIPYNLQTIMIKVIQEAASRANIELTYGMFLTIMFSKFGVVLEEDTSQKPQHVNIYND